MPRNIEIKASIADVAALVSKVEDEEPVELGVREANDLLRRLDVDSSLLVAGAYVDLLADRIGPG